MGSTAVPIVILHGLFGSHRNWQSIAKALGERLGRMVITADLRNHGQSTARYLDGRPEGMEMSWPEMVKDITRLLDEIDKPVIMMGHSLGGQILMQTLAQPQHRKRITKAIVVDIAPKSYNFEASQQMKYLREMQRIQGAGLGRRAAMEEFQRVEPLEAIVQFLFTNWGRYNDGREGFLIPLDSIATGMITLGRTFAECIGKEAGTKIPTQTLFIKGANSGYLTNPCQVIDELFQDYDIQTIKDSGHWPHYDRPDEFLRIIQEWLRN